LTGEALGLFYAGVLLEPSDEARRWRDLGYQILTSEIDRQMLADGVYFEQSTCYHRYTVEIYLHFLMLARRDGLDVPEAVREDIELMVEHLALICRSDGSMPDIGDADGGWVLPVGRRGPR